MRWVRNIHQSARLFLLAGLALLLGASAGMAVGEPLEAPPGLAEVKPATPMPKFTLPSLNGATFDASQLQGKVVVVRFWATW